MKRSGLKAHIFLGAPDASKIISDTGTTTKGQWYRILEKGDNSNLPFFKGYPFRAPKDEANQIALVLGDSIQPIEEERYCKTTASLNSEQGSIDVGDDCDPGAEILDGIIKTSGSFAGLFRFNDATSDFDDATETIINRFYDIAEDDGQGTYELISRTDDPVFMLVNLNSDAKVGQMEIWAYIPINITSMGNNLGNSDAQNKDISWTKGEGQAVFYRTPKAA